MVSAACDSRAGAQGRALAQALVLEARSRAVAGHGHVHDHPPHGGVEPHRWGHHGYGQSTRGSGLLFC